VHCGGAHPAAANEASGSEAGKNADAQHDSIISWSMPVFLKERSSNASRILAR
jgi:hypothetical protein